MRETTMIEQYMIEQLVEQRIAQLEFRVQTLEKAVLAMAENLARLEQLYRGATRLLDGVFKEKESKQ